MNKSLGISVEYISTGGISIGGKSSNSLTSFNELGRKVLVL